MNELFIYDLTAEQYNNLNIEETVTDFTGWKSVKTDSIEITFFEPQVLREERKNAKQQP